MKCVASPTLASMTPATAAARAAQATLQAIVFSEILKPLAKGLGPVGEIAADSIAQRLFVAGSK